MARPQFADGGTASNMESIGRCGQPTRRGPLALELGDVLTPPHRKAWCRYERDTIASGLDLYVSLLEVKDFFASAGFQTTDRRTHSFITVRNLVCPTPLAGKAVAAQYCA